MTLAFAAILQPAEAADQKLLLDVYVNGYAIGVIGQFTLRDDALFTRRSELSYLAFQVPPSLIAQPDDLIPLALLPGVTWRLDMANQRIYVTAANDRRLPKQLETEGGPTGDVSIQSGTGLTLNYDVQGSISGGEKQATGLFDLRGFSLWGVVNSGLLVRAVAGNGYGAGTTVIRLDSTAEYSDVDTLRRYMIGDFVTDDLSWMRSVRFAGAQMRSDFSMKPDLVTFPLPTLAGAAAVPSTLDVFANGAHVLSSQVQPGPFEVPNLPMVTGAGDISMTLTNALGNQITSTASIYVAPTLLAPGLETFALQGGFVRRYFGVLSNDYGALAGSAVYRRGLTDDLTVEAGAEATSGMYMAGGGINWNAFNWAVLDAATSVSHGLGHTGMQIALGIQHLGTDFSYSGTAIYADKNYLDIAAMNGDPVPRLQLTATLGITLGSYGALGIAYARIDQAATPVPGSNPLSSQSINDPSNGTLGIVDRDRPARLLSASYSIQIQDISLSATAFHNFASDSGSGALLSLTLPLGPRSSASASVGGSPSGGGFAQIQAQQSASDVGDWGYQAYASEGEGTHAFGEVQYKSPYRLYSVGVDQNAGQTQVQVETQGAFSLVEGNYFGSNPIPDSFALVKTGNVPDVHVLQENRDAGTTNHRGLLVVPDLRSFEINHLAIDPSDIPPDATIDTTALEIRPQDRSGVVVDFQVKFNHGALLKLVDEGGKPMPVGSKVTLLATGTGYPVGYDGDAYVENLQAHNVIEVERLDGMSCRIAFDYKPIRGDIPKIGPLSCRMGAP
ncbi:MAG: fimbria/pilus outer membrane usher protein [Rhizomicrobium sp.]